MLTTGEQHPWAAHELSFGEAAYWAQHDAGDDVFYAGRRARSGVPRPVPWWSSRSTAVPTTRPPRALPWRARRAGALLIVCGDPQQINSVLGAGV